MILDVLKELQEEIELYCDPNERVTNMLERYVDMYEHFKLMDEIRAKERDNG